MGRDNMCCVLSWTPASAIDSSIHCDSFSRNAINCISGLSAYRGVEGRIYPKCTTSHWSNFFPYLFHVTQAWTLSKINDNQKFHHETEKLASWVGVRTLSGAQREIN